MSISIFWLSTQSLLNYNSGTEYRIKSMKSIIGIMSGRLSNPINNEIQCFPFDSWREEFKSAENIGFQTIDWVVDLYKKNPIFNNNLIEEMKSLIKEHHIDINVICADYFLHKKLFNESKDQIKENIDVLETLIKQANKVGAKIIEIPFVDNSSLRTSEDKQELMQNLDSIKPTIEENEMSIALETDLPPKELKNMIREINHPNILLNYDVGNSTSKGFDVKTEWEILNNLIISVHIKDRKLGSTTVPLGTGDVDFKTFFESLQKYAFAGNLIIQGAREDLESKNIQPEETCKKYFEFVKQYLD